VEDEYVRDLFQQWQAKPILDSWLRPTGDEDFHLWDLRYKLAKDRQDRRSGLLVLALVQSVDHNHGRDVRFDERPDYQLFHLVVRRLVGGPWIRAGQRDKSRSKFGVLPRKLNGQGGEYKVEVAPVLEVSGAEERGTELIICEQPLRDRLSDRAFSCPSQPVEPVDGGLAEVS